MDKSKVKSDLARAAARARWGKERPESKTIRVYKSVADRVVAAARERNTNAVDLASKILNENL